MGFMDKLGNTISNKVKDVKRTTEEYEEKTTSQLIREYEGSDSQKRFFAGNELYKRGCIEKDENGKFVRTGK